MHMVLNEGTDSQRIKVVFYVYTDNSIKNPEREKRGSENGHELRNIKADHKIHHWPNFLSNSKNISLLIKFIAEEWQNEWHKERLAGKIISVTAEDYIQDGGRVLIVTCCLANNCVLQNHWLRIIYCFLLQFHENSARSKRF